MREKKRERVVYVDVVDWDYKELSPTNAGKAGRLLRKRKAIVYRKYPFVIRIKKVVPLELVGKKRK